MLAYGILVVGGIFYLLYSFRLKLPPFDNLLNVVAGAIITYRIVRHRFLDIEVIIRRGLVYSGIVAIISSFYATMAFLLGQFPRFFGDSPEFVSILLAAVAIAVGFKPLEEFLSKKTDKIFFKGKYDYQKTLQEFSQFMSTIVDLDELLRHITSTLAKEMRLGSVTVLLKDDVTKRFRIRSIETAKGVQSPTMSGLPVESEITRELTRELTPELTLELTPEFIQNPKGTKNLIIEDLKYDQESSPTEARQKIIDEMGELHAAACFPIVYSQELIGILTIGEKLSGDILSNTDIGLLATLTNQAAISIRNAKLYEEIQNRLEQLLSLNEIGRTINETLNLEIIMDRILEAIIRETKVDRALVFLLDEKANELVAIAGQGDTREFNLQSLRQIRLKLDASTFGQVLRTGDPLVVSDAATSPGQTKSYVRLFNVDSYIAVPLRTKDKMIGVIGVDNKTSKRPIEQVDLNLLSTLCQQASMAIENARLFDETKQRVHELFELNQQIEQIKRYNEDVLRNMTSGVISIDQTGTVLIFNESAERITGQPLAQVSGNNIYTLFPAESDLCLALEETVRTGEPIRNFETHMLRKKEEQEEKVPISLSVLPTRSQSGEQTGALAVLTDLKELKELQQAVIQSEKLATLGTLTAGLAHEIKNPLSSMKLFVHLIKEKTDDANFMEQFNTTMLSEIDRLTKIVNDFVGFSRPTPVTYTTTNLKTIIERVDRLVKVQLVNANVKAEVRVEDLPEIQGDAEKLTQVFLNLFINATHAMPKGGSINVTGKAYGEKIEVRVSDTGTGISPENLKKLFKPFFSTKGNKGTGLGLSITQRIIQDHNGDIHAESTVGKGTTFVITLPIAHKTHAFLSRRAAGSGSNGEGGIARGSNDSLPKRPIISSPN